MLKLACFWLALKYGNDNTHHPLSPILDLHDWPSSSRSVVINYTVISFFSSNLQIQGKPVTTVKVTQQTQGAQTTARAQRSPAQRRRSQNK